MAKAIGVLDLGAAPGGWCQVALARVHQATPVVGIDLLACEQLPGASFIQGDFTEPALLDEVAALLPAGVDVLLSDAAPDLSGIRLRDEAACEKLHAAVFTVADHYQSRAVVLKSFMGIPLEYARELARERFAKVTIQRLKASKKASRESYIVAKERLD